MAAAAMNAPRTWAAMLAELSATRADDCLFRSRVDGDWQDMSWRAFGARAKSIGLAMLGSGYAKGDVACILAAVSTDWLAIDAGLTGIGVVSAGIYPTEPPERLAYILNDCAARCLFVDSPAQLAKALTIRSQTPALDRIVTMGFAPDAAVDGVVTLEDWIAASSAPASAWDEAQAQISPADGAILIYTSGTTGPPKGALISHGAVAWQVSHSAPLYFPEAGWTRPTFLPLCHIGERYFTFFAMAGRAISYMVEEPARLGAAIVDFRPHFILAVPRIFEKIYAAYLDWRRDTDRPDITAALERGLAIADVHLRSPQTPIALDQRDPADAAILMEVRDAIGIDRARIYVSGGASFPPDLLRWYLALGIPMLEMYGMSETGTIATNLPGAIREATVGPLCDFTETKLLPSGEIAVRGPGLFSRYLNKPDATASAFDGDWFLTGDLGTFDDHGHLKLIGRLKDLIITSGGKNISPAEIERRLCLSPYIQDAAAIGDGRKFVSALIIADADAVAEKLDLSNDIAMLATHPDAIALIDSEIAQANATLSHVEQVKRFRILPRALRTDGPELTPTLKLKRAALCESFSPLIEEIYAQ